MAFFRETVCRRAPAKPGLSNMKIQWKANSQCNKKFNPSLGKSYILSNIRGDQRAITPVLTSGREAESAQWADSVKMSGRGVNKISAPQLLRFGIDSVLKILNERITQ